jgi:peptidoglycan/xylan/chitin deacetylase (PgdA/CDA1 family)
VARLDRLATLYVFWPLRRYGISSEAGIPILMYHSIANAAETGSHPYYRTTTSPAIFADHMRLLHEQGYMTISLHDAVKQIEAGAVSGRKQIVITFDDGYQDFYQNAVSAMDNYGFSATVFLPTAYIGESPKKFKGIDCLTWSQVRDLSRAGTHFGSHTVNHPQLRTLAPQAIREEVRRSKETIEGKLSCATRSFAYPFALPETDRSFKQRLRGILVEAGYENGVSTIIGTADQKGDRFFLKRLPVNSCDDPMFFRGKLEGAYNWLHVFQYSSKLISTKR